MSSGDELDRDLHEPDKSLGGHVEESHPGDQDKALPGMLPELGAEEIARLSVLEPGTRLDRGSTDIDLDALGAGGFTAMGGDEARSGSRIVAKRDTDHELWSRITETA